MNVSLSEITKTLVFHYYPAWIAWSGIYCLVFCSLNWQPHIDFINLFTETQLQVVFVYLFIIASLYLLNPPDGHFRLLTIFSAMISAIISWEAGSFLLEGQISLSETGYQFSIGFILLRVVSGSFIIWCFMLAERYCLSELMLREEKIQGLLQEKKLTDNEIRYYKARIDPELLFEKLQTIFELRNTNPERAKSEQLDLVKFLRDSLSKTNNGIVTDDTAKI